MGLWDKIIESTVLQRLEQGLLEECIPWLLNMQCEQCYKLLNQSKVQSRFKLIRVLTVLVPYSTYHDTNRLT